VYEEPYMNNQVQCTSGNYARSTLLLVLALYPLNYCPSSSSTGSWTVPWSSVLDPHHLSLVNHWFTNPM